MTGAPDPRRPGRLEGGPDRGAPASPDDAADRPDEGAGRPDDAAGARRGSGRVDDDLALLLGGGPVAAAVAVGLDRLELRHVRVPLRTPFVAAHGTEVDREVVVVRAVAADDAEGWGECDALAAPTYTAEWTAGAFAALRDELGPLVLAGDRGPWAARAAAHPMAAAAVERAVVDLALRRAGRSLAGALGATVSEVPAAVVLGRPPTVDALVARVARAVEDGAPLVKVKVAPDWLAEPLGAVRSAFPDLALAADANGSFRPAQLAALASSVAAVHLAYLEQPLAPADDHELGRWPRRTGVALVADESVAGADDVARLVAAGVDGVNVKPARVGGLGATRSVVDACRSTGASLLVGGMLELGVGRAAAVAVAAAVAGVAPGWPTDVGPSDRYVAQDITEPVAAGPAGTVRVPAGPGIGRAPIPARLEAVTVDRATVLR